MVWSDLNCERNNKVSWSLGQRTACMKGVNGLGAEYGKNGSLRQESDYNYSSDKSFAYRRHSLRRRAVGETWWADGMKVEVLASTASGSTIVAESNRKRRSGQINLPPPPSHLPLSRLAPLISWREQPATPRYENRRRSRKLIYRSGPPDLLMRYSRGYGQQLSPRTSVLLRPLTGPVLDLCRTQIQKTLRARTYFCASRTWRKTDCAVRVKLQQPGPTYGVAGRGGRAGRGTVALLCVFVSSFFLFFFSFWIPCLIALFAHAPAK